MNTWYSYALYMLYGIIKALEEYRVDIDKFMRILKGKQTHDNDAHIEQN